MLFLRFTSDRKAEVMESSTGGCNGKVCRNVYPLSSLLARGYRPVRYRVLEGAPGIESKEVALMDQGKADADEKSKNNSKKSASAHDETERHASARDRSHRSVRHHRKHSSRE